MLCSFQRTMFESWVVCRGSWDSCIPIGPFKTLKVCHSFSSLISHVSRLNGDFKVRGAKERLSLWSLKTKQWRWQPVCRMRSQSASNTLLPNGCTDLGLLVVGQFGRESWVVGREYQGIPLGPFGTLKSIPLVLTSHFSRLKSQLSHVSNGVSPFH